jgi:hypothetical protein
VVVVGLKRLSAAVYKKGEIFVMRDEGEISVMVMEKN